MAAGLSRLRRLRPAGRSGGGLRAELEAPWLRERDAHKAAEFLEGAGEEAPAGGRNRLARARELERRAGAALEQARRSGLLGDVDLARISERARQGRDSPLRHGALMKAIAERGPAALEHPRGRDLDARAAEHDLVAGQVRIGRIAQPGRGPAVAEKNPAAYRGREFGIDLGSLCTSLLVVGPPGSGKTMGFAEPVVEHLALQTLAGRASLVVLDPKGSDFEKPGWFDFTIDIASPSPASGFSLFGGADSAHEAADRLATALLPVATPETAYFVDSAKNALYAVLAPFHAAHENRWPTVRQLLDLLTNPDGSAAQSVRDRLRNQGRLREFDYELATRERQTRGMLDAAASLAERLGLLNRPHLVRLLDETRPRFEMRMIDEPCAVRIALPEARSPDAVRILARLAVSQFVQVVSSPGTNRAIFKGLICDEASRFIDDYVTAGVRQIRSNNAGMVLFTQSVSDIPLELRDSLFGSVGGKAVFAGLAPQDARLMSEYWGTEWVPEVAYSTGASRAQTHDSGLLEHAVGEERLLPEHVTATEASGSTVREVERALWSQSEITNSIPPRHCVVSLASRDGRRTPPLLVDLSR